MRSKRADLAVAHEEVGDLVEKRGVSVVQVCAGGDRQRGKREFGAIREW